jgi:hypothetical protein
VTLCHARQISASLERTGESTSLTESDASRASYLSLETLAEFLSTLPLPAETTIILFSSSASARKKVLDADPHDEQETSIKCLKTIDKILLVRPAMDIRMSWLPVSPFCWLQETGPRSTADEPHIIKSQKQETKAAAVLCWHQSLCTSLAPPTFVTPTAAQPQHTQEQDACPCDEPTQTVSLAGLLQSEPNLRTVQAMIDDPRHHCVL